MSNRRLVLTAYDVAESGRLKRALEIATAYSHGGQKSCHEAWASGPERLSLAHALDGALNAREDAWALFALGANPRVRILGRGRPPADPPAFIFGWTQTKECLP